ncbi:MAG: hypothetical protein ABIA77_00810, partial [Candidatus Omnitrophota bacterium]
YPLYLASGCFTNDYFHGTLDDVAIWDRALDANEISSLYNISVQGFEGLSGGINTTFGLGYTTAEIELLSQLYADGKDGLNPENITIAGTEWQYYPDALPGDTGYDIGTAYIYEGKNFIKLGSGVGEPLGGAVPELPAGAIPFLGVILSFGLSRLKRSHK